jgi:hypothetical protein
MEDIRSGIEIETDTGFFQGLNWRCKEVKMGIHSPQGGYHKPGALPGCDRDNVKGKRDEQKHYMGVLLRVEISLVNL